MTPQSAVCRSGRNVSTKAALVAQALMFMVAVTCVLPAASEEGVAVPCTTGPLAHVGTCRQLELSTLEDGGVTLTWAMAPGYGSIQVAIVAADAPYISVGVPRDTEDLSRSMVSTVVACTSSDSTVADAVQPRVYDVDGYRGSNLHPQSDADAAAAGLSAMSCSVAGSSVTLLLTKSFSAPNADALLPLRNSGDTVVTWAAGKTGRSAAMHNHGRSRRGTLLVNLRSGSTDIPDEKMAELAIWHSALCLAAWGVLIPAAVNWAAFHKQPGNWITPAYVKPGYKEPAWMQWHVWLSALATVLTIAGLVLAIVHQEDKDSPHFDEPHKVLGLIVVVGAVFQPLLPMACGGFAPAAPLGSAKRFRQYKWLRIHNGIGYGITALSIVTCVYGIVDYAPVGSSQARWLAAYLTCIIVMGVWALYRLTRGAATFPRGEAKRQKARDDATRDGREVPAEARVELRAITSPPAV